MENAFDLEVYLSESMDTLVRDILRATIKNPKASIFFAKYAISAKKAATLRHIAEKEGEHIPSFLIASITGGCNLRCAGCYDRANREITGAGEMSCGEWRRIFSEASELGISTILLAGGEPLMRVDVLEEAALHPDVLFPVFTNGTLFGERILPLFEKHRNLIPIISIEGDQAQTDARRGEGVYAQTENAMARLKEVDLLFGASITVTNENLMTVTDLSYIDDLHSKGCRAVVFVEYVPLERPELALDDAGRSVLDTEVARLREKSSMVVISFPGDENELGGCLAAGRGFFHINAGGGAEPCPFSPYSDTSLKTSSLREALHSPLFTRLREDETLMTEHIGGCALFARADFVRSLIV